MFSAVRLPRQWRSVALPAEHGGWSLWLEPVLLGVLVAPSWAAVWLALASFTAFLARQPLKIAWTDHQRGRRYQRTLLAERFAALYLAITVLAGALAFAATPSTNFWWPLLLVSPLLLVQVYFDARHDSRHWLPEVAGPVALASLTASMALAAGWSLMPALALSGIIICRAVPTVWYVRARLRLEKGQPAETNGPVLAHVVALIVLGKLALLLLVPALSLIAGVLLLGRAAYGLSRFRRPVPAKVIGVQEIVFGLLTVGLAVVGLRMA